MTVPPLRHLRRGQMRSSSAVVILAVSRLPTSPFRLTNHDHGHTYIVNQLSSIKYLTEPRIKVRRRLGLNVAPIHTASDIEQCWRQNPIAISSALAIHHTDQFGALSMDWRRETSQIRSPRRLTNGCSSTGTVAQSTGFACRMGKLVHREKGTPQGAVVSPLLANLFLRYAFDCWMRRKLPDLQFERHADDAICHCRSEAQAQALRLVLEKRLAECR